MSCNPYQVLYFNPSINSIKFAKMAEKYHNDKDLNMLKKVSEITGYRVVESERLNWRQREKYQDNKFQISYHVYYLIPPNERLKLKEIK